MNWKKHDKVMYRHKLQLVPAVVLSVTESRVRILALVGERTAKRNVKPESLSVRTQRFEELDDE
jgi:hypothetical protein